MQALYNIGIHAYNGAIQTVSLFNDKARLMHEGRKDCWQKLEAFKRGNGKRIWFHAASLGEFEQGRPLIEMIKEREPDTQILLSFFSPSGYEIRKNYALADCIVYLPGDSPRNAKRFVELAQPDVAIFIKYEYWYNYLNQLNKRNIPTYIISSLFRDSQPFFKWWGGLHREMLSMFNHLFVQDQESVQRLASINITNVTRTGDTRFDRVKQIADTAKSIERVETFLDNQPAVVCGSTWAPDEEILFNYINNNNSNYKWIIAPHEIHNAHIQSILALSKQPIALYSDPKANLKEAKVLIIDCIGLLSSIYRYGQIAYIGGGFGVGIHNTLEAAVYGIPVIFGPKYRKFNEAVQLIEQGAAFSIGYPDEFYQLMDSLIASPTATQTAGKSARNYVESQLGATNIIYNMIQL
ncbi:MAG: 3-deoxy-D-manno-octulosonic acid transferase [Marinifilaceae bacterium]